MRVPAGAYHSFVGHGSVKAKGNADTKKTVKFSDQVTTHYIARYHVDGFQSLQDPTSASRLEALNQIHLDVPEKTGQIAEQLAFAIDHLSDAIDEFEQSSLLSHDVKRILNSQRDRIEADMITESLVAAAREQRLVPQLKSEFAGCFADYIEFGDDIVKGKAEVKQLCAVVLEHAKTSGSDKPFNAVEMITGLLKAHNISEESRLSFEIRRLFDNVSQVGEVMKPEVVAQEIDYLLERYCVPSVKTELASLSQGYANLLNAMVTFIVALNRAEIRADNLFVNSWMAETEHETGMAWLTGRFFGDESEKMVTTTKSALETIEPVISNAYAKLQRHPYVNLLKPHVEKDV